MGIAGRLAISFVAVGVLAAVANVIVIKGVSIVEITRVAATPTEVAAPILPPAPVSTQELPVGLNASAVADAVDQFDAATAVRAQFTNPENDAR
ncbi:MAG: hypothetical protein ABW061_01960, partial [Polyangiaceae bacterium]